LQIVIIYFNLVFRGKALSQILQLNGDHYLIISANERRLVGKFGVKGFIFIKTEQLIIVWLYDENLSERKADSKVQEVAENLEENGY